MKANIEVKDRKEAEHVRAGLADPAVRAFVVIMGALSILPSKRARARVMHFVEDALDERDAAEDTGKSPPPPRPDPSEPFPKG
jgi:hypothetical protein